MYARRRAGVNRPGTRAASRRALEEAAFPGLGDGPIVLRDLLGNARFDRNGAELGGRGLYLDVPGGGFHVFEVRPA
jgi:hypothetical protein